VQNDETMAHKSHSMMESSNLESNYVFNDWEMCETGVCSA